MIRSDALDDAMACRLLCWVVLVAVCMIGTSDVSDWKRSRPAIRIPPNLPHTRPDRSSVVAVKVKSQVGGTQAAEF